VLVDLALVLQAWTDPASHFRVPLFLSFALDAMSAANLAEKVNLCLLSLVGVA